MSPRRCRSGAGFFLQLLSAPRGQEPWPWGWHGCHHPALLVPRCEAFGCAPGPCVRLSVWLSLRWGLGWEERAPGGGTSHGAGQGALRERFGDPVPAPKDPGLWKIPIQASVRGDEGVNRSQSAAFSFGMLKPFSFNGKRIGGSSDLLLTPKSPFPGQGRGLAACTRQGWAGG